MSNAVTLHRSVLDQAIEALRTHESNASTLEAIETLQEALAFSEPVAAPAKSWPQNATEVRAFFHGNVAAQRYAREDNQPDDDDKYTLTTHDFLSAIEWWSGSHEADAQPTASSLDQVAVEKAVYEAVTAIYLADNSDYLPALRYIVKALAPDLAQLLERDGQAAWEQATARVEAAERGEASAPAENLPLAIENKPVAVASMPFCRLEWLLGDTVTMAEVEKLAKAGVKLYPQAQPTEDVTSAYQRGYLNGMDKGHRDAERDAQERAEKAPVAEVSVSHVRPGPNGRYTAEVECDERLSVGAELFLHSEPAEQKPVFVGLPTVSALQKAFAAGKIRRDSKLYTAPPSKRGPLNEVEINLLRAEAIANSVEGCWTHRFARNIEAAHLIN